MFKRVEKRRRKQEEEEELGLDEDARDVLGLNDTDSDESESDSDDSESEPGEGAEDGEVGEENEDNEGDDGEDSSEDEDDAEEPPISVKEALRDPVYVVSIEPDVKACIVCPGKLLKKPEILTQHRASKAHERRWQQFIAFAKESKAAADSNAWDVLKLRAEQQPKLSLTPSTVSKRSEKKEKQKAKIEARRAKKREAKIKAAKAKKAASEGAGKDVAEPVKKKRKVEDAPVDEGDVSASTKPRIKPPKKAPRTDRVERQGKPLAKPPHEPPGGRGKGNGKKPPGSRGKYGERGKPQDERGKRQKKDGKEKFKPLQIFD